MDNRSIIAPVYNSNRDPKDEDPRRGGRGLRTDKGGFVGVVGM